jgi:hypothetical protein
VFGWPVSSWNGRDNGDQRPESDNKATEQIHITIGLTITFRLPPSHPVQPRQSNVRSSQGVERMPTCAIGCCSLG